MSSPQIINIQDAKTHLSRYVDLAAAGEEIILGKAGKPLAKLTPYKVPCKQRKLGLLAGVTRETPDAWSPETDAEMAAMLFGDLDATSLEPSSVAVLVSDAPHPGNA